METESTSKMSPIVSPWGKQQSQVEPVNLADIMSEQLAHEIHSKQVEYLAKRFGDEKETRSTSKADKPDHAEGVLGCDSDEVIAATLQAQFDREYDDILKKTEDKFNGTSKVSISFSNYRNVPQDFVCDSDSEEEVVDDKRKDWDRFVRTEKEFKEMPKCGYKRQGDGLVTKHDSQMNGRRNACRIMKFPPEFQTGDGGGFDMQLSNKVFNSLKAHSRHESSRRNRLHDKSDASTSTMGLDEKTRLILFKLVDQGMLEQVNGVLSTGKEAVILHADGGQPDETVVPRECAIKVFKTTLNEFKTRDKYIKDDYRFKDRFSKQNPRKIVHLWAEKELHNLNKMREAGIRCPEVVTLKQHVLVMSFIGEHHRPAPKLKDAVLSDEDVERAYQQTADCMRSLYLRAGLVHADLSEYNILWHNNNCWFIDVGQAVERNHPSALEFLRRDCRNVCAFFSRRGTRTPVDPAQLFDSITGTDRAKQLAEESEEHRAAMLSRVKDFERNNDLLTHDCPEKTYPFNYCWDQSQTQPA